MKSNPVVRDAVLVSGRVLNAADDTLVAQFRITPGIEMDPRFPRPQRQRAKSVEGTNGTFSLEISAKRGLVVFQAEAKGYLPLVSEPLNSGQSNCALRLKRGSGPTGVVQLPDGTPLANTKVAYLSGDDQASLDQDGELRAFAKDAAITTDAAGKFSFAPKGGGPGYHGVRLRTACWRERIRPTATPRCRSARLARPHMRVLCIETESATRRILALTCQQDPEIRIQLYDTIRSGCILELRVKVGHARLEQLLQLTTGASVPAH